MKETEQQIRQRVEQGGEPSGDGTEGKPSAEDGNADSGLSRLPVPSLSKRQMLLIAAAVAALVVVHQIRSRGSASGGGRSEAREALDDIEPSAEVVDEDAGVAIEVPANPEEELDKDDAVLDALFRGGD